MGYKWGIQPNLDYGYFLSEITSVEALENFWRYVQAKIDTIIENPESVLEQNRSFQILYKQLAWDFNKLRTQVNGDTIKVTAYMLQGEDHLELEINNSDNSFLRLSIQLQGENFSTEPLYFSHEPHLGDANSTAYIAYCLIEAL